MAVLPLKVVVDTNVIISAVGFGGNPRKILNLVVKQYIIAVTSLPSIAELEEVVYKKFPLLAESYPILAKQLEQKFNMVRPNKTLYILKDADDNKVLEAAVAGDCDYIITGDKELLDLGQFETIKIVTAAQFLSVFNAR